MLSSATPLTSTASTEITTDMDHHGSSSRFTCFGEMMTRTKLFDMLVDKAWETIDDSKDGRVDEAELYAGLLFVHISLAQYAGLVACFPPSRASCDRTFRDADVNHNKYLNQDEFRWVMGVMCAAILGRMLVYFLVMILTVPFVGTLAVGVLKITDGSYSEIILRFAISCVLYYAIVPSLWNCVEKHYGINATESEELIPSDREEQRARRRNEIV